MNVSSGVSSPFSILKTEIEIATEIAVDGK